MSRGENHRTPKVMSGTLYTDDEHTGTRVGSPAWFAWLASGPTFYYESPLGAFTARCEIRRRGSPVWVAYRRCAGVLRRVYLGKADHLLPQRLEEVVLTLNAAQAGRKDCL